jgi:FKBP-type peptidyl-prolyl cis-trans isomerase FkpA
MQLKGKHNFTIFISCFFIAVFSACGIDQSGQHDNIDTADYKEHLVNVNHKLVQNEDQQIEDYISRYGWKMIKTGTGLRYLIYSKGNGNKAEKEMTAQIRFSVELINGEKIYDSKTDGMKSFKLGKAEVESGLEEGIMLMHAGDKAKLIIPSHLAFGLLGDENKIPKRATLIYDVELVAVY